MYCRLMEIIISCFKQTLHTPSSCYQEPWHILLRNITMILSRRQMQTQLSPIGNQSPESPVMDHLTCTSLVCVTLSKATRVQTLEFSITLKLILLLLQVEIKTVSVSPPTRTQENMAELLDSLKAASVWHKQCLMISSYKHKDVGRQGIIKAL